MEAGESDQAALRRELRERLDVDISVGELISFVSHPYALYTVDLYLYQAELAGRKLQCQAVNDFRWVASADFDQFAFTPADEASMNQLLGMCD